jgi:hypothetical protein
MVANLQHCCLAEQMTKFPWCIMPTGNVTTLSTFTKYSHDIIHLPLFLLTLCLFKIFIFLTSIAILVSVGTVSFFLQNIYQIFSPVYLSTVYYVSLAITGNKILCLIPYVQVELQGGPCEPGGPQRSSARLRQGGVRDSRTRVSAGQHTSHKAQGTSGILSYYQCCDLSPERNFSAPDPGSRVKKIPDPDPQQRIKYI